MSSALGTAPIRQPASLSQATAELPLQVTHLSRSFRQGSREVPALTDVSLTVRPAEFVAIMGASGSGKSTLLNLIAGMTRPDSGRIMIDGIIARMPSVVASISGSRLPAPCFRSFRCSSPMSRPGASTL